jgi:hypothetical protein
MLIPVEPFELRDGQERLRALVLVRNAKGRMLVWRYGANSNVQSALFLVPATASLDDLEVGEKLLSGGKLTAARVEPMLPALRDALGCPELQISHVVQRSGAPRTFEVAGPLSADAPGLYFLAILYAPDVDAFYTAGELCEKPSEAIHAAQLRLFHGGGEVVVGVRAIKVEAFGTPLLLDQAIDRSMFDVGVPDSLVQPLNDRIGDVLKGLGKLKPSEGSES